MLNRYPLWKSLLIIVSLALGGLYALPNLYPDDLAIQISGARSATVIDEQVLDDEWVLGDEQVLKKKKNLYTFLPL